jgi:hypothetical protein
VRVDVDARQLDVFDRATLVPREGGTVVPLRFRDGSAFVDVRVASVPASRSPPISPSTSVPRTREKGRRFAAPFEHDMTGMVFDPLGQDRRGVHAVLPGSPAEEVGVAAGDVRIAVDGVPLRTPGPGGLNDAFRRDGAEVRVTPERASARIERRIRLRRLV